MSMPHSAYTSATDAPAVLADDPRATSLPPSTRGVLVVAAVLMGLIAGFFYAYACSVMLGLALVDDRTFVVTMQAINSTVRNPVFAVSFFGSLVVTGAAAALARGIRTRTGRRALVALALYAGAFVVTMTVNVPMNEQLAVVDVLGPVRDLASARADYEAPWVRWNMVRTVLATAACAAVVVAVSSVSVEQRAAGRGRA